jgi:hypothetical protein
MCQDFLAIGCPLCATSAGSSGAVYLYRLQSASAQFRRIQLLRSDLRDITTGLLVSSSMASPSVHDGSSFGSSLSVHVSNGGVLTLAVAAMHCNFDTAIHKVMAAGAVFIFYAEVIPFNGDLLLSLSQKQIVSPVSIGFSALKTDFSLGRSVSISSDGRSLGICGGVGICEALYIFERSDSLGGFAYRSFEDFSVVRESTLFQSFRTASISQDRVGIVGSPFYNRGSGAVFLASPVHLGFGGNTRHPAEPSASTSNFDFELVSLWLQYFYNAPNYNVTNVY